MPGDCSSGGQCTALAAAGTWREADDEGCLNSNLDHELWECLDGAAFPVPGSCAPPPYVSLSLGSEIEVVLPFFFIITKILTIKIQL